MPRPRSDEPRDQQVLVRLTRAERRVLYAAAVLDQATVNKLVHDVVKTAVRHFQDDPLVLRQLELLEEQSARRSGAVVPISRSARSNRAT
jgi:hypothetical protein